MDRITSFTINHDVLMPGFYISRKDGDITTYDLRTRRPNKGDEQCRYAFCRAHVCNIYP